MLKTIFCRLKQLVKYYERLYALLKKVFTVKMSHCYQMNPKVLLYYAALSAQLPCLAGLSLYRDCQLNFKWLCMQGYQCSIHNGTLKALSDQLCIRYKCFSFFKLIIFIVFTCVFSATVTTTVNIQEFIRNKHF